MISRSGRNVFLLGYDAAHQQLAKLYLEEAERLKEAQDVE
jgi:hypothetical protein